jgi:hypothetical protein
MFLDAAGHNITLLHLLVSKVKLHKNVMIFFFFVMINFVKTIFTRFVYNTVFKYAHAIIKRPLSPDKMDNSNIRDDRDPCQPHVRQAHKQLSSLTRICSKI